jgi:hypothetical protein
VRTQAAAADGVVLTQTLAPDGRTSDVHVEAAATLPVKARARLDSLIQSLEHVAMQLPAEPVGIGATWRERKPLPEGGIRAVSEATYTLTALAGSTATYMGTGRAISGPQTLEQDGTKVEVINPRGHSETKGTIDLARFAPAIMSTSTFAAEMSIDAPKGTPGAGTSTVEVTVAIQMGPAGPPDNEPAADPSAGSAQLPAPPAGSAQPPAPPAGSEPDQGAHSAP